MRKGSHMRQLREGRIASCRYVVLNYFNFRCFYFFIFLPPFALAVPALVCCVFYPDERLWSEMRVSGLLREAKKAFIGDHVKASHLFQSVGGVTEWLTLCRSVGRSVYLTVCLSVSLPLCLSPGPTRNKGKDFRTKVSRWSGRKHTYVRTTLPGGWRGRY